MAKSIKYWLKAGNLIDDNTKKGANLTPIGELMYEYDRYFEDIFSLWIVHINICFNKGQCTSWYVFFNKIMMEDFSKDELESQKLEHLREMNQGKKISERSLKDDISVLLNMYVKEKQKNNDPEEKKISPFTNLELIKRDGEKYMKNQPGEDSLNEYIVMYAIEKFMEMEKTDSISIEKLLNEECSPGKILNLKRVVLNRYIDKLANDEYLTVNRTAGLDMIYLNKQNESTENIILRYYQQR